MPAIKLTFEEYYKGFEGPYRWIASVPFLLPIIRILVPDSKTLARYLFPPLGDVQRLALTATVLFLVLITIVVYVSCPLTRKMLLRVCGILLVGFLLSTCAWIILFTSYVREIPLPSVDQEIAVSVGSQRTPFALQEYPNETDWQMLRDRGPWEAQIQTLWTRRSIITVRSLLWLSYTLTLACFLSVVSFAAYEHAKEKASPQLAGSGA